ncbi:hypothetical protein REPUB_Repub18cG0128400 [Reevesia pubescens]
MKGRSSKQEMKEELQIDKISKLKEEPHLSGAYIRSLVKQLTSSRTKEPMNPKDPDSVVVDADGFNGQNLTKFGEGFSKTPQTQQPPQPPQQHKKQVRRRLHTSRPYQERLLNMAEARREIVTALKFHRAAMKQATEQQQQQQQQQQPELQQQQLSQPSSHLSSPPPFEQESKTKSRRNPRIYPSSTNNFSTYNLDNFSYSSFSQHYPPPPPPHPNPYSWPASPIPHSSPTDTLNFTLPNQTLGLNLNFHDFNNIDTNLYHNSCNNPSIYSSSSPSSSSSPTLSVVTEEVPFVALSHEVGPGTMADLSAESYGGGGLHHAMDDEEMAEIRSLGEQHQMEWNDTMNLVKSAWWFKFLKTMELGPEVKAEDDGYQPFDQVMEFPSWLNTNDSSLQQHFNDLCPDDYFQDPALPW